MVDTDLRARGTPDLPERHVTPNQLVAYNMAVYRRAGGWTQEEFGGRLGGWSGPSVSAAERSWDGKRIRKFDVDEVLSIAEALGVPFAALFLPPPDDGISFRYVLDVTGFEGKTLKGLIPFTYPVSVGEPTPAVTAYRKRLLEAGSAPVDSTLTPTGWDLSEIAGDSWAAQTAPGDRRGSADRDAAERSQGESLDESMEKAAQVLAQAQAAADEAIETARREGDDLLARCRDETYRILGIAKGQAELITGDARSRAESLERDAQERHRQAMGSLVIQREQLERRVDDLREFEREYRTRLVSFVEAGYRDLWSGVEGVDADDMLREVRTRAEQLGAERFSVVVLSDDGTYDSFTSEDLQPEPAADEGTARGDEYAPPEGLGRGVREQAAEAAQDLRDRGIPGPYVFTDKDGVITAAPTAQAAEEVPNGRADDEGKRLPAVLLP